MLNEVIKIKQDDNTVITTFVDHISSSGVFGRTATNTKVYVEFDEILSMEIVHEDDAQEFTMEMLVCQKDMAIIDLTDIVMDKFTKIADIFPTNDDELLVELTASINTFIAARKNPNQ